MVSKEYQEKKRHFHPYNDEDGSNVLSGQYYLHLIYLEALRAPHESISKGDPKGGILSLELAADQALRIAGSVKKIDREKLEEDLRAFDEKATNLPDHVKKYKRANYILSYILSEVYDRAPKTADLML